MVDPASPVFDVDYAFIEHLNGESHDWAKLDGAALQRAMQEQGADWFGLVSERCPHIFAAAPVFISESQLRQMKAVIAAVEEVVGAPDSHLALGVFYGYDFHLNQQGVHLIEINSNAGGAFLNALLIDSQRDSGLYGTAVSENNPAQSFIEMFRNEWRSVRGDAPLNTIAIVDEQPESQYLYPEFLLAQQMFEQAGIAAYVVDSAALHVREDDLYLNDRRIDLIYNRLTDFDLKRYPHIRTAWEMHQVVLTPNPLHYQRYADKRKLALFSDGETLREMGLSQASIDVLIQGIPQTRMVHADESEQWWTERKQWFFKPVSGYGSKGAYRGDKLTKRVFEEIVQGGYIAQRLAVPGERVVNVDGVAQSLKYDVRCYVYDGKIQLVAARLYQGQTTNFRTPGGGFALVRIVE